MENNKSNIKRKREYLRQVAKFFKAGDYQSAEMAYTNSIQVDPNDSETYFWRAQLYMFFLNKIDKALKDFDKAIKLKPECGEYYLRRAQCNLWAGKIDDARQDYAKAAELAPENSMVYLERALFNEHCGSSVEVLKDCDKIIELEHGSCTSYFLRAMFYEKQNMLDEALQNYTKAIEVDPKNSGPYHDRAKFYEKQTMLDKALQDYTKAIEVNPKDSSAYRSRAEIHKRQGKFNEALNDHNKAVELDRENFWVYLERASFYRHQGGEDRLRLAIEDVDQAINLERDRYKGHYYRGLILLDLHKYSEARQSFETALRCHFESWELAEHPLVEFYHRWTNGLSAYYQDALKEAQRHFSAAVTYLDHLPLELKKNKDIIYLDRSLTIYLQLIPLDNELKEIFKEYEKLAGRGVELELLYQSFSNLHKRMILHQPELKEMVLLTGMKRDICRILLPLDNASAVGPEQSEEIIKQIESAYKALGLIGVEEFIANLKMNRRNLEDKRPFTTETPRMGNQADGLSSTATAVSIVRARTPTMPPVTEALRNKYGEAGHFLIRENGRVKTTDLTGKKVWTFKVIGDKELAEEETEKIFITFDLRTENKENKASVWTNSHRSEILTVVNNLRDSPIRLAAIFCARIPPQTRFIKHFHTLVYQTAQSILRKENIGSGSKNLKYRIIKPLNDDFCRLFGIDEIIITQGNQYTWNKDADRYVVVRIIGIDENELRSHLMDLKIIGAGGRKSLSDQERMKRRKKTLRRYPEWGLEDKNARPPDDPDK